jgi:salicylate hydroxylase
MSTNGKCFSASDNGSTSARPLNVIIVGAGLGGLFAAIAFRKAGHHVHIYESSRFAVETGAAIHLPSNVNGLLRRYGMFPENYGANQCEWVTESKSTGEHVFTNDLRPLAHAFPYPWQLCHRIDLHNALKEIATRTEDEGKPVVIHLQSRVTGVDVDGPSIALQNGTQVNGDLVVGADGVHVRKAALKND